MIVLGLIKNIHTSAEVFSDFGLFEWLILLVSSKHM